MAVSIPANTSSPASTANAAFADVPGAGGRLGSLAGLSIANGLTAGYGVNDDHVDNPPAYPGTYGGNPAWAPQRIGVLRNVPGTLPGGQVYSLYFIYNPNQIQTSFSTNTNALPAQYIYGSPNEVQGESAGIVPNLTNGMAVSWTLLFDRTYDMLRDTNPEENRGVLRDTAAFYNLMGTFVSTAAVPLSTPCQVVFGQTGSGQLWGFTGYITSGNIVYGQFRHNMIPSRAQVDVQMQTTYIAPQVPSSSGQPSAGQSAGGLPSLGLPSVGQIFG